jgi:hypothetical protein
MRAVLRHLTLIAATGATAASIGFAPAALAGPDAEECRDAGIVLCHKPGSSPNSPGGPDPASQQLLGGNAPNLIPPLIAIG